MFHQIFQSLRAHSSRSLGLLIELIIVTIIGWIVIEPIAVDTSRALIPAGYDHDRLVMVNLATLDKKSADYDTIAFTNDDRVNAIEGLRRRLASRKDVEYATIVSYGVFDGQGLSQSNWDIDKSLRDSVHDPKTLVISVDYYPGTDFFKTFGIKTPAGQPFEEPLYMPNTKIISETFARALYPGGNALGKELELKDDDFTGGNKEIALGGKDDDDDPPVIITGVVADATYSKGRGRTPIEYTALPLNDNVYRVQGFVLRIAPDADLYTFLDGLKGDLSDYRAANYYLSEPSTFEDRREEVFADTHRELLKGWIIAIFFLVNILLGVAGTFYIQSRTRIPEAGVMRAFGATRRRIEGCIVGEAVMLVLIGWVVGSALYLTYLHSTDYDAIRTTEDWVATLLNPMWYDTLPSRLTVIGL
ncbi:MAG: hypothetical protein K2H87_05400, partial [Duncaniella sp.]|nr:hypothetical protein [Duncaniella sp.]